MLSFSYSALDMVQEVIVAENSFNKYLLIEFVK